jgi:blocked-early-in-transport protein 1
MAGWGHRNGRAMQSESSHEMLDRQNQMMTENLAMKVSRLRDLAVDIETETKDSNRYLSSMDGDFEGTTSLLSGSLKRINFMVNSGKNNRRLMCYLILGLVLVFFALFYLISWLRT